MAEIKRGCGYRKVGGLYLVGEGYAVPCDMLPLEIKGCPTCGFEIPFYRGFMWLNKKWVSNEANEHHKGLGLKNCRCWVERDLTCPICYPNNANDLEKYGFMWVGAKYYTPDSFRKEAEKVGVCKRISQIPKGLTKDTWILLAHKKVPFSESFGANGLRKKEPTYKPAVFYAFRPVRVEMLIWKSKATKRKLAKLKKAGISPVIIEDGAKNHTQKKRKKKRRRRL